MSFSKTESFVPLVSGLAGGKNREFKVTVVPQSADTKSFNPISATAEKAVTNAGAPGRCEPKVTLERDGDRISSIRVQCSCGQVMDLACIYDDLPKPK